MKLLIPILFIAFTVFLHAQDSIKDSILTSNENLYIDDHKNRFNVKFDTVCRQTNLNFSGQKIREYFHKFN